MITEDLSLDIRSALADIDRVEAALDAAARSFGDAYKRVVTTLPPVAVNIDRGAITRDLQAALDAVDATALGNSISRDLNAAGVTLDLNVDQAQLAREIQAAINRVDTSIRITASAANVTGAINAAVNAANTNVTINGTANVGGVNEAAEGFTFLGSSIKAAVAAAGAYVGIEGVQRIVAANSDLYEATTKVQAVYGDLAGDIIDFSKTTAANIGFSQRASLEAIGTFGNFFTSAGLSTQQAADMSTRLTQLAADLASFNNIDVEAAFEKLRAGLAGEIRPLRDIGISITEVEAEAKALELGLVDLGEEVGEQAELQARYALILEKSANAQGDFARTSDGLANQQRILRAQFEDILTVVGAPLVSPLLSVLQSVVPLAGSAADAFGRVVGAILPAVDALVDGAGPALNALFDGLGDAADEAAPGLLAIATSLGDVLGEMTPLIEAAAVLAAGFGRGVGALLEFGGGVPLLVAGLGALAASMLATFAASGALSGGITGLIAVTQAWLFSLTANPIGLFITGIVAAAAALGALNIVMGDSANLAEEIETSSSSLGTSLFGGIETITDLTGRLRNLNTAAVEYLLTQSAFARDASLEQSLQRTRISTSELTDQLIADGEGFKDFAAEAVAAGEVVLEVAGTQDRFSEAVTLSAAEVRALDDDLGALLQSGDLVAEQGSDLLSAFQAESFALRGAAQDALNLAVQTNQLTQAQLDAATAFALFTAGPAATYVDVANVIATQLDKINAALDDTQIPLGQQAGSWLALSDAILRGKISSEEYQTVAGALGVDLETIDTFARQVTDAVDQYVDTIVDRLPQASEAFEGLATGIERGTDTAKVIENLNIQTASITAFIDNIDRIREESPEAASFLLGLGEAAAGPLADDLADGRVSIDEFSDALANNQNALADAEARIRESTLPTAAAFLGASAATELGLSLDFQNVTNEQVQASAQALMDAVNNPGGPVAEAENLGKEVGKGFQKGIEAEMASTRNKGAELGKALGEAARKELGINSPSKVFQLIGAQVGQGFNLGLDRGFSTVGSQITALTQAAVPTAASLPTGGAAGATTLNLGNVQVTVQAAPGVTAQDAADQGRAAGDAFADQAITRLRLAVGNLR